jgi:hypothetical protein
VANSESVLMEGVQIIFRNFRGEEGKFNQKGSRNFGVLLTDDVAHAMAADEWNVKWLNPRDDNVEEDAMPQAWLPVEVSYRYRPPRVVLITSRGRTNLDESSVEMLDWANILNVDLIVNPSRWTVNEKTGIKAYLQSMYVTIEEDALERKYADVDDAS